MRITYSLAVNYSIAVGLLLLTMTRCQQTVAPQQDNLSRYIACNFGGKLSVEESDVNAKPFVRSVRTSHGSKGVTALHGYSLHIAYAATPFVNFKAERLKDYAASKDFLIDNLGTLTKGTKDMEATTPREDLLNGFDSWSIDRAKLSGGVQSIYLLFRDADETVVTLYILNTPREAPQFSTIEQYHELSGQFVQDYTECVDRNLK